jgi:uncharacterized protein (DUF305 family)
MGSEAGMPGTMTEAEMKELASLSGAEFDRNWASMMTTHHKGAIQMARNVQKNGKNSDVLALAKKIESAQAEEVKTLQRFLGQA